MTVKPGPKWNQEDPNSLTNGNTPLAISRVRDESHTHLRQQALEGLTLSDVYMAPQTRPETVVPVFGVVLHTSPLPSDSGWTTDGDTTGKLVYLAAPEGVSVEFVNLGPTGAVQAGQQLVGFGYAVGYVPIQLEGGDKVQGLRIVGRMQPEDKMTPLWPTTTALRTDWEMAAQSHELQAIREADFQFDELPAHDVDAIVLCADLGQGVTLESYVGVRDRQLGPLDDRPVYSVCLTNWAPESFQSHTLFVAAGEVLLGIAMPHPVTEKNLKYLHLTNDNFPLWPPKPHDPDDPDSTAAVDRVSSGFMTSDPEAHFLYTVTPGPYDGTPQVHLCIRRVYY